MHDWNRQNREWTPLEAEQYSLEFRTGIESEIEAVLGEENEFKRNYLSGSRNFLLFSGFIRNEKRLFDAARD